MTKCYEWTLESLKRARCVEVGNCWEWTGSLNSAGHPTMTYMGVGGVLARRIAFCLAKGIQMDAIKGLRVWNKCCNPLCINPACSVAGGDSAMFKAMKSDGRFKASPKKRAANTLSSRSRSTLTMQDARDIREAVARGVRRQELAERYKKSDSLIDKIVSGECWREGVQGASVFNLAGCV